MTTPKTGAETPVRPGQFYFRAADDMHLPPEAQEDMDDRLSDWHQEHWLRAPTSPETPVGTGEGKG